MQNTEEIHGEGGKGGIRPLTFSLRTCILYTLKFREAMLRLWQTKGRSDGKDQIFGKHPGAS